MEKEKESNKNKMGIEISDSSGVTLERVKTTGYEKGIGIKNVGRLKMKDVETIRGHDLISKRSWWYRNRKIIASIVTAIGIIIVALISLF